jgi:hypothetical protein
MGLSSVCRYWRSFYWCKFSGLLAISTVVALNVGVIAMAFFTLRCV